MKKPKECPYCRSKNIKKTLDDDDVPFMGMILTVWECQECKEYIRDESYED